MTKTIDSPLPFQVGDTISYLEIVRSLCFEYYPIEVSYTAIPVRGKVIKIRDLEVDKLSIDTIARTPDIERSRYLVTVLLGNKMRSTYHGCMVELQVHNTNPTSPQPEPATAPIAVQNFWCNHDVLFDLHPSSKVCCR